MTKVNHPQMIPVPIQDFLSGVIVPVNLYVKLNDNKFILVSKAGNKTNREQIKTYEDKTVEYLWVKRADYALFARNNMTIAGVIVTQNNLNVSQKSQVLGQAASTVFLELEHAGMGFETYSHSKQIVEATVALTENHRDLSDLLLGLKECSDELLRHSLAVSYVSILIAHTLGWENKQTLEKLTLGALLHDIGLKVLPPDIIAKPKGRMTYEENLQYEQHPYKGMQMLLSLGIVPDDVIAIVYEHHENAIGQGYPRKLRNIKIHPLAKVVALADEFCNLTMKNPNCPVPKSPREALLTIEHTMGQPHNKEAFRALQLVVNKEFARSA
ncbi:MAG: HD domain-containing protein [Bdellovibrionales bacterium]|nr:HD domain-containing protein [Bdellovibrionales bacterium]